MPEIKKHDSTFEPRHAGRPPRVDVSDLAYEAVKAQGLWVSKVYENLDAASAVNQFKRRGMSVSSLQVDADHREVYVKFEGGTQQ